MWCCDACSADGQTFEVKNSKGETFHMCRRCTGKLKLSLPVHPTAEQLDDKIAEMTGTQLPVAKVQQIGKKFYPNQRQNTRPNRPTRW